VLIDATNPFGHGHTLPRGLLREPPSGLARAHAILITRVDSDVHLSPLLSQIRGLAPAVLIAQSRHVVRGFVDGDGKSIDTASVGRVLAMSGIGNPEGFHQSLRALGANVVEAVVHSDHHHYRDTDLRHLLDHRGAYDTIVTTEKDWVKLRQLPATARLPFARAQLAIDLVDGDENKLLSAIESAIALAGGPTLANR
jgi:tetraacyldisaccharide 4'-kinase